MFYVLFHIWCTDNIVIQNGAKKTDPNKQMTMQLALKVKNVINRSGKNAENASLSK